VGRKEFEPCVVSQSGKKCNQVRCPRGFKHRLPGYELTKWAVAPVSHGLYPTQEALTWDLALPSAGFIEFVEFVESIEFIECIERSSQESVDSSQ
jgi:hypothetical protein